MSYPKVEVVSLNYTVTITTEEMLKILHKDTDMFDADEKDLFDLLDALPYIIKVDYNGMFGPHIFLEIFKENDTNKNWKEILDIITTYIRKE